MDLFSHLQAVPDICNFSFSIWRLINIKLQIKKVKLLFLTYFRLSIQSLKIISDICGF